MQDSVFEEIQTLIADYIDVKASELSMDADLDLEYDMDSTELTEFAKKIQQRYGISITKTDRQRWETGRDIAKLVSQKLALERDAV